MDYTYSYLLFNVHVQLLLVGSMSTVKQQSVVWLDSRTHFPYIWTAHTVLNVQIIIEAIAFSERNEEHSIFISYQITSLKA